ncbi:hypothetical protein [Kitasatospora aureofaciens]|uniref:hypothetical protein n=1 Tax=Kitasatospora aureofaciens TaxID=1894 RepID=UPI000525D1E6|nr:hypothetical protein [Kitasatospora aureofaciens]
MIYAKSVAPGSLGRLAIGMMGGGKFSGVFRGRLMTFKSEAGSGVAERDEWSYSPGVGVGPLRFGMTVEGVVEAAEVVGQTKVSECARRYAIFSSTWKVEVHRRGTAPSRPAVAAYVSQAVGLFCIAADAVHGPQVAYDGIPLVGRDLSELESDASAYPEAMIRPGPDRTSVPEFRSPGMTLPPDRPSSSARDRPPAATTGVRGPPAVTRVLKAGHNAILAERPRPVPAFGDLRRQSANRSGG